MQIYTGLNYYEKLDILIQQCINDANENKFKDYFFISDQPVLIEKMFFKYTNELVNIRVLSYAQYLNLFINQYHLLNEKVLTSTELIYLIYQILHEESFTYLNQPTFTFVKDLAKLMKDYRLALLNYNATSSDKLNDFKHLHDALLERLDTHTYLTKEEILYKYAHLQKDATFYIDGDLFLNNISQAILNTLDSSNRLYVFYNCSEDDRVLNMPAMHFNIKGTPLSKDNFITDNLFKSKVNHINQVVYNLSCATPLDEVNHVVSLIHQYIVDEHLQYKDFTIVYPNDSYRDLLSTSLNNRQLPHHLKHDVSLIYHDAFKYIIHCIGNDQFKSLKDLSTVQNKLFNKENDDKALATFKNYLALLNHFDMPLSRNEMLDFFTSTFTYAVEDQLKNDDYIHVTDFNHPVSSPCQYVFYLGLNETVLPETIKDQQLLLDEDLLTLKEVSNNLPLNSLEHQGLHENNILKAFLIPAKNKVFSYALTTLNNDALLPSTLVEQLKTMYNVQEINEIKDLSIEDYYLGKGQLKDKQILNNNIGDYISSKHSFPDISEDIAEKIYPEKISVSQLETYNKCPFQYFLKYGLALKVAPTHAFMSNELGSLTHYVLEKCVNTDIKVDEAINQYIDDEVDGNRLKEVIQFPMNKYFLDNLKSDLPYTIDIINQFLNNSSYNVLEKELHVEDSIADIPFKGYVDRVDSYNDHIMIVDYKPSTYKDINLSLAIQGFNIQMLLYLKAACRQLNKQPSGVLYFAYKKRLLKSNLNMEEDIDEDKILKEYQYHGYVLKDAINDIDHSDNLYTLPVKFVKKNNDYSGNVLTSSQLEKLYAYIEQHISELYKSILKGVISLTPKGSENTTIHASINPCTYCDFKAVCEIDHFYNEYTMVEDLDVQELLQDKEQSNEM